MRTVSLIAVATLALLLCGCGSNNPPGGATPAANDTLTGDSSGGDATSTADTAVAVDAGGKVDAGAHDGKSAKYPCSVPSNVTTPTRKSSCEKGNDDKLGCTYPWGGVEAGGTKFTCNICRGGDKIAQGVWRFIDFNSETPATKLKYEVRQRLLVVGNTWHFRRTWTKDGTSGDIRIDGWYFCSDVAEQGNQDFIWVVTSVSPPDSFGYSPGHVYSGSWKTKGNDLMAWGVYEGIHTGNHFEEIYCRVGSEIKGTACKDPFNE